jgi:hypothetical protein
MVHGWSLQPGFIRRNMDDIEAGFESHPLYHVTDGVELQTLQDTHLYFVQWPKKDIIFAESFMPLISHKEHLQQESVPTFSPQRLILAKPASPNNCTVVLNGTIDEMQSTERSSGVLVTVTPQPQHRNSV